MIRMNLNKFIIVFYLEQELIETLFNMMFKIYKKFKIQVKYY